MQKKGGGYTNDIKIQTHSTAYHGGTCALHDYCWNFGRKSAKDFLAGNNQLQYWQSHIVPARCSFATKLITTSTDGFQKEDFFCCGYPAVYLQLQGRHFIIVFILYIIYIYIYCSRHPLAFANFCWFYALKQIERPFFFDDFYCKFCTY